MKSIVITGGTSGLGLQAAFNLGSQFDNMYIIGKNEEKGQSALPVSYTHLTLPTICSV